MRTATVFTAVALISLLTLAAFLPDAEKPPETGVRFAFADSEIDESSGLVALGPGEGDLVVTVNDSGDEARVFTVDPDTGETVGTTRWDADVADVEALAPAGPPASATEVWVADIGDNYRRRDEIVLYRVPVARGDRVLAADEVETYRLRYPGGARDAESLMVHPGTGRLLVASKGLLGGHLYQAPAQLDVEAPMTLERLRELPGMLTDGSFFADGEHLIVRSYGDAYVYTYPELALVGEFPLPSQRQGEGLAVTAEGGLLLSTEGKRSDVLQLEVPAPIAERMTPQESPESTGPDDSATGAETDETESDGAEPGASETGATGPWRTVVLLATLAAGGLLVLLLLGLAWRWLRRRRGRRQHQPQHGSTDAHEPGTRGEE